MSEVIVHVPATTANLGPGFDCLAMALDLWNEVSFAVTDSGFKVQVEGYGEDALPLDGSNLILQSAMRLFQAAGCEAPGWIIHLLRQSNSSRLRAGFQCCRGSGGITGSK